MILSVVVSAYSFDRVKDLIEVIDGIKNQSYKDIELIVVIDENQKLFNTVKEHISTNNMENANIIFNPKNKGLSNSRNIGVINSTGKIIAFIDDDAFPDQNWARALVETFENDPEIGAIAGEIVPFWEYQNMSWFPKELHWMISCSYVMTPVNMQEVDRGFGANMAFLKEMIIKAGMFDINLGINGKKWLGGEDTKMFLHIKESGKKVIFNPNAIVHHKIYSSRIKYQNIVKRAFNGGLSIYSLKNVISYDLKSSTENTYLKRLLLNFYPKSFITLVTKPSMKTIKQISAVSCVILCETIGYLYGDISEKFKSFRQLYIDTFDKSEQNLKSHGQ